MTIIKLETYINAPIERVFDLARSIELHQLSAKKTNERAIAGRTKGLIELGETVTWRGKHFGIYQNLTAQVTNFDPPYLFADRMIKGAFSTMDHHHIFERRGAGTKMTDIFEFSSPMGILGRLANCLFVKQYMRKFILTKNKELKTFAEGDRWKEILK